MAVSVLDARSAVVPDSVIMAVSVLDARIVKILTCEIAAGDLFLIYESRISSSTST